MFHGVVRCAPPTPRNSQPTAHDLGCLSVHAPSLPLASAPSLPLAHAPPKHADNVFHSGTCASGTRAVCACGAQTNRQFDWIIEPKIISNGHLGPSSDRLWYSFGSILGMFVNKDSAQKVPTFHPPPRYPDTGLGLGLSTRSSVSQRYSTVAGHSINSCP